MKFNPTSIRALARPAMLGVAIFATAGALSSHAAPAPSSPPAVERLSDVLWRPVQNRDGKTLGSISDLLVEMPSGKIVLVLIDPTALYAEPKAVPPDILHRPADAKAPYRLDLTLDEWRAAPRLDWDPKLIMKDSDSGARIYAYYQQQWLGTARDRTAPAMNVVAEKNNAPQPIRFVSLSNLVMQRVATDAWPEYGFVRGFLLDWKAGKATSALVSPSFNPVPGKSENWYAIPVPLLNPPVEQEALTVNTPTEAFRTAQHVSDVRHVPATDAAHIFAYPPPPGSVWAQTDSKR